jgi:hypothetical protein
MDAYDLTFWEPDADKWWVKPLLRLPVMLFVGISASSHIPLPFQIELDSELVWSPHLENYGHERSLLESISWDNFLARIQWAREVAKGLSFKIELLAQINRLFSPEVNASLQKASFLVGVKN